MPHGKWDIGENAFEVRDLFIRRINDSVLMQKICSVVSLEKNRIKNSKPLWRGYQIILKFATVIVRVQSNKIKVIIKWKNIQLCVDCNYYHTDNIDLEKQQKSLLIMRYMPPNFSSFRIYENLRITHADQDHLFLAMAQQLGYATFCWFCDPVSHYSLSIAEHFGMVFTFKMCKQFSNMSNSCNIKSKLWRLVLQCSCPEYRRCNDTTNLVGRVVQILTCKVQYVQHEGFTGCPFLWCWCWCWNRFLLNHLGNVDINFFWGLGVCFHWGAWCIQPCTWHSSFCTRRCDVLGIRGFTEWRVFFQEREWVWEDKTGWGIIHYYY